MTVSKSLENLNVSLIAAGKALYEHMTELGFKPTPAGFAALAAAHPRAYSQIKEIYDAGLAETLTEEQVKARRNNLMTAQVEEIVQAEALLKERRKAAKKNIDTLMAVGVLASQSAAAVTARANMLAAAQRKLRELDAAMMVQKGLTAEELAELDRREAEQAAVNATKAAAEQAIAEKNAAEKAKREALTPEAEAKRAAEIADFEARKAAVEAAAVKKAGKGKKAA